MPVDPIVISTLSSPVPIPTGSGATNTAPSPAQTVRQSDPFTSQQQLVNQALSGNNQNLPSPQMPFATGQTAMPTELMQTGTAGGFNPYDSDMEVGQDVGGLVGQDPTKEAKDYTRFEAKAMTQADRLKKEYKEEGGDKEYGVDVFSKGTKGMKDAYRDDLSDLKSKRDSGEISKDEYKRQKDVLKEGRNRAIKSYEKKNITWKDALKGGAIGLYLKKKRLDEEKDLQKETDDYIQNL